MRADDWTKQRHRVIGSGIGLLVAWGLLLLPMDKWSIAIVMMALKFVIERIVVRHYALAPIGITTMMLLFAESASLSHAPENHPIQARFYDTVPGCLIGMAGGVFLHPHRFRVVMRGKQRHLLLQRCMP